MDIGRLRCIKGTLREVVSHGGAVIEPLSAFARQSSRDQKCQEVQQVTGEIAVVSRHDQTPDGVLLHDFFSFVLQPLGVNRFVDKARIPSQHSGKDLISALVPLPPADPLLFLQKVVLPKLRVCAEIIVPQLRLLSEPVPFVLLRAVIPAVRQIGGAELVAMDGNRGQELIVQLCGLLRFLLADIGDVQGVMMPAESVPVVLPVHAAGGEPAVSLEHTPGEDDVHIPDRVLHAPQIGDGVRPAVGQEVLEVHLVQHALHIRHTDLERGVDFFPAEFFVHDAGVLFGDQSLAVKAGDFDVLFFLNPVVFAGAALGAVVLYGDDVDIPLCARRIVDDHHPVGPVNFDAVDPHAAGQHQAVVGVELAELAVADGHVHHDTAAHRVVKILPDEGQPRLTAHAARAFEGQIAVRPGAEVQAHSLGAEQSIGLLLPDQIFLSGSAPVEDAGEVHIENDVREIGDQLPARRSGKGVAVQCAHDLIKQRAVVLLVGHRERFAFFRLGGAEMEHIRTILFSAIADYGSGGQFVDLIFHQRHPLTS